MFYTERLETNCRKIIHERQEVTHNVDQEYQVDHAAQYACALSIAREKSLDSPAKPMSGVLGSDCTLEHLINLAFTGMIGVQGKYACFAPQIRDQFIIIDADTPIQLEQFLPGGKLLKWNKLSSEIQGIAWFRGNLHLFKKKGANHDSNQWWIPTTLIGHENANGKALTEFILRNLPAINEFTKSMNDFHYLTLELEKSDQNSGIIQADRHYSFLKFSISPKEYIDNYYHSHTRRLKTTHPDNHTSGSYFRGKLNNLPDYAKQYISRWKLNRESKDKENYSFGPGIIRSSDILSESWKFEWMTKRSLEILPQSEPDVAAERFAEFRGKGALCG